MNVSQIGSILLTLLSLIGLAACAATIMPTLPSPPTRQPTPTPDPAKGQPNRLINEKSPYLLQHAYNPVNWYPWGQEAFDAAQRENKPIFLSIGYATCHWCHVMEKESFEDPAVARLMNDTFISIKVDREERPDLDNLYMNVAVGMNGSGGWPLTIIMTPDRQPFLAATYIPKENRFGRVGLLTLLPQIKTAWATQQADLVNIGSQVISALQQSGGALPGQELDQAVLDQAYQQLSQLFDSANGGFGNAPKFPAAHNLLFLLRYGQRAGDARALPMVETTLQKMRQGGVYDQIGFGFHRYATDARWRVPHFEKMLYDQAMLALVYAETYQATGKEEYAQTTREILTYVLRDMTAPEGGFYSAEDADSEGEEGKFYLWTEAEIRQILPQDEADLVITAFNVTATGNFTAAETTGANILYMDNSPADLSARLEPARQKLFETRQTRPRPLLDDKILTDWNGLMIAALAKSAQALREPAYAQPAARAADFILTTMRRDDGRLFHRYRDGEAALQANLDDYAFLTWGLLELYETTFDTKYLNQAIALTDEMIAHFEDDTAGGFYFTPDDGEVLPIRRQEIGDSALPAGNSVAMLNLLRLGRITANPAYEEKAARLSLAFAGNVRQTPSGYTHLLAAVNFALGPSAEVVISGDPAAADTQAMLNALWREFAPNKVVLLRPPGDSPDIVRLAGFTKYQLMRNNQATAYVCFNYHCKAPTHDIDQMVALLQAVDLTGFKNL